MFTMPEAQKYEQNKTVTTDTDYEHINRKKQKSSPSESLKVQTIFTKPET